ncbi:efflux RND transporter periplasmic adaptor subunit, partial [Sphingomonas sp. HMWF008]
MSMFMPRTVASLALVLALAACGGSGEPANEPANEAAPTNGAGEKAAGGGHTAEGKVTLSADQIVAAGIQLGRPTLGGSGTVELPATIEGDPQGTQVVSAAIGGRVVSLSLNLGQSVRRGQSIAVIESREAAQLKGEVEASRARLALANS